MPESPRILALAGSARTDSFNKKLIRIAAEGARDAGASVTLLDLAELPLPLYDGDLETREGLPANARTLKEIMLAHQGLLLACPEYNSSITPLLKNAIDWASRKLGNEPPLACFTGKVAALMSTSPGALGGLRGLVHVRAILGNIGVIVLPGQVAVPRAAEAFAPDGTLEDPAQHAAVRKLGETLAQTIAKLHG